MVVVVAVGFAAGIGLQPNDTVLRWVAVAATISVTGLTLGNLLFGTTISRLHGVVQDHCLRWFLKT